MFFICTSVKPLTQLPKKSFSPNWRNRFDGSQHNELAGWSHSEKQSTSQCLDTDCDEWSPLEAVWEPVMVNIFTNTDSAIKCTPGKFADNTQLSGATDMPEGEDPFHRDLDKL